MAAEWYYARGGQQVGPVDAAQLEAAYRRGEITDNDYVWTPGMANWAPAGQVRNQFVQAPAAVAPAPAQNDALAALGIQPMNFDIAGPVTSTKPVVRSSYGDYAGFWRRLIAIVIDSVILYIASIPVGLVFAVTPQINQNMSPEQQQQAVMALFGSAMTANAIIGIIYLIYFVGMECSPLQATVGKLAIGIKVTDLDGDRLSVWRALGRYLGKIVSTFICFVGFIMAAFTERKQALHDMMAGTLVVRK